LLFNLLGNGGGAAALLSEDQVGDGLVTEPAALLNSFTDNQAVRAALRLH
jgi:hypothetical protein